MTRQETLNILRELNDQLDSMTDEELYEHMMKTSPSFKKTIENLDKYLKSLDDYPGPRGHEKITEINPDEETVQTAVEEPYDPYKEAKRSISVADLMSLKNILENYKYHTLKEIEDIICDSQDILEIKNRSDVLLKIEDGLNMINKLSSSCGNEKAE